MQHLVIVAMAIGVQPSIFAETESVVAPASKNTPPPILSKETARKIADAKARQRLKNEEGNSATGEAVGVIPQLEELRIFGTFDPRNREKSPIQKMRETLDQQTKERSDFVTESTASDGARYAQVNVGGKIYCIEERRGIIDFAGHHDDSGLTRRPPLTSPMSKTCRKGQY